MDIKRRVAFSEMQSKQTGNGCRSLHDRVGCATTIGLQRTDPVRSYEHIKRNALGDAEKPRL